MPFGGLLTVGLIGAGSSIFSGIMGSNAAKDAAQTQAQAEEKAAQLQATTAANSLAYVHGVYNNAKGFAAPYQGAGTAALSQLSSGTAPGGEFNSSPTGEQVLAQDPGYEFRLQQGQQALERAEAAGGGVGSGGALKSGVQFGQDYASNEYQNAYTRFMSTRQANYSDLANIANLGESATSTLDSTGMGTANTFANTGTQSAAAQGNDLTSAAAALAAGDLGSANAWSSALGGLGTNLTQSMLLNQLKNSSSSGYNTPPPMGSVSPGQWSAYDAGSVPVGSFAPPAYDYTNLGQGV